MKKYKYRKTFQVDGKRYSVYADTKKELMEKEIRKKIEIENDERRLDSSMTLRAWAEQCVDTYKTNQKDIPRDKYTQRMEHCILDHIGNLPLAPDLIPYCLRHEYCTELARRKVDIRTAQKLIGHSDIKLTANIYTNLNNDDIADIAAELSQGSTWVAHKKVKKGHKKASENSLIIKEKTAGILHSSGLF